MMATALLSLAASSACGLATGRDQVAKPQAEMQIFLLDASAADSPNAGYLTRLAERLPLRVRQGKMRDVPALLGELIAELEERQKNPDDNAPPLFVMLFALQRCRDLRRAEDDFGFGRREGPPPPPQLFTTLLREGPALGIHTLLWCDTFGNLQRALDRQALREFELRVPMQMSVTDSSNMIDTALASKLGEHRALLFSEEDGRLEKFRPYGLPAAEWLGEVESRLRTENGKQGRIDVKLSRR